MEERNNHDVAGAFISFMVDENYRDALQICDKNLVRQAQTIKAMDNRWHSAFLDAGGVFPDEPPIVSGPVPYMGEMEAMGFLLAYDQEQFLAGIELRNQKVFDYKITLYSEQAKAFIESVSMEKFENAAAFSLISATDIAQAWQSMVSQKGAYQSLSVPWAVESGESSIYGYIASFERGDYKITLTTDADGVVTGFETETAEPAL
ncbi:MAG: DUF3887 domain-containing protein [Oscillospiraceae bacterium]|nr:DUF3887 domain-containing protein [Oscillospiraceae bacterium]